MGGDSKDAGSRDDESQWPGAVRPDTVSDSPTLADALPVPPQSLGLLPARHSHPIRPSLNLPLLHPLPPHLVPRHVPERLALRVLDPHLVLQVPRQHPGESLVG